MYQCPYMKGAPLSPNSLQRLLLMESSKKMLKELLASSSPPVLHLGRARLFPELGNAHRVLLVSLGGLAVRPGGKERLLCTATFLLWAIQQ